MTATVKPMLRFSVMAFGICKGAAGFASIPFGSTATFPPPLILTVTAKLNGLCSDQQMAPGMF
jgi:hypothetical protein